jgi:multidrug efflux pump subunit AcrA (membrane-fusion protein)
MPAFFTPPFLPRRLWPAFLALVIAIATAGASAHEGHDHGPKIGDTAATGPVTLSPQARQNLGIQVVEIEIGSLQKTVSLLARVQPIPEKTARLSARIDGQVGAIHVRLGQSVRQSEPLLTLVPLAVDTPPVVLRAPFDGVVMAQNTSVGLPFTPETVLVELADLRQVLVRGEAYENADLSAIQVGTPVKVQLDFFHAQTFAGVIERMAPALAAETRTFEIYALLENADLQLKPNLQGAMFVGVGEEATGVSVPARAVLGGIGNHFVFVETEENTFERRPITLGLRLGDRVEVLEGVLPGDRLVVQGNYQLQFASAKKPAEAAPATGGAQPPAETAKTKS